MTQEQETFDVCVKQWLQSGANLKEYSEHQQAGFPLFMQSNFGTVSNWEPDPGGHRYRERRMQMPAGL